MEKMGNTKEERPQPHKLDPKGFNEKMGNPREERPHPQMGGPGGTINPNQMEQLVNFWKFKTPNYSLVHPGKNPGPPNPTLKKELP